MCVSDHVRQWRSTPDGRLKFREKAARYEKSAKGRVARTASRNKRSVKSPSRSLYVSLYTALRRRPSDNPVTHVELLEMWDKQQGRCALSGVEMTWANGQRDGIVEVLSISLDRINQTGGYEADNVRLVCHALNSFRGRMSDVDMLTLARAFVAYHA